MWIHLALGVFVLVFLQLEQQAGWAWGGPEKWSQLSLLDRWAVFSLHYPQVYLWSFLLGEVAGLVLLWRGLSQSKRRPLALCYFLWLWLVASVHMAVSVYFNVIAGIIRTPDATFASGGWSDVVGVAVMDGMFACPAVLVVLALWLMRARSGGLCSRCGYDLAGLTTEQCPECGGATTRRRRA